VLSNEPATGTTNFAQRFFPIARPIRVEHGERVKASLTSYDAGEWRWQVDVGGERFDHSTFWGVPASAHSVRRAASDDDTPGL
jgi:hypothetical protein